jgi:DNA adenine methylase
MISGYWTKRYAAALKKWNSATFEAMTRGGRTTTEWLWFNFLEPVALHDHRYLGQDFRERERIKRKKQRWVNRLHTMPTLERRALLAAIGEAWLPDSSEGSKAMGRAPDGAALARLRSAKRPVPDPR